MDIPIEFLNDVVSILEKHFPGKSVRMLETRNDAAEAIIELVSTIEPIELEIGVPGSGSGGMDASLSGGTQDLGNMLVTMDAVGKPAYLSLLSSVNVTQFSWEAEDLEKSGENG